MNERHLRYFLAVVDTGSASAAARACFITQPALSRQIGQLERDVGTPLFRRTAAGLRLTSAGTRLVPIARDIGIRMDRGSQLMRSLATGQLGLVLACPAPMAAEVFAPLIAERCTPISDVREFEPARIYEQLTAGVDLVVGTVEPPRGLERRLAFTAQVFAHAPSASHAFPGRRRVDVTELVDHALVVPRQGSSVRLAVDQALAEHSLSLRYAQEVSSSTMARALAAAGRGTAIVVGAAMYGMERVPIYNGAHPVAINDWVVWEADHYAAPDIAQVADDICQWMDQQQVTLGVSEASSATGTYA